MDEWRQVSSTLRPVLKVADSKFFACPQSVITPKTWHILGLVNECTNGETDILNLPFPGTILDQPGWFREAVRIVRNERNRHRREQMEKSRS